MKNKPMNKLEIWICAVAKMEELYIREWIIWNKKIGITHIIIGDNNDSNYHIPLQPIIQDFIDEGYVELINKNDIKRVQNAFYKEIYQLRKREFDFIGFIDIDEFIELPAYENNINNFLSDSKFVNYDAIIIPWLNYGDNDQLYYENKPLKERFIKPILKDQSGIKYFIKSRISRLIVALNGKKNRSEKYLKTGSCHALGSSCHVTFDKSEKLC